MKRVFTWVLRAVAQPVFRIPRGLTLGVRVVVVDGEGAVLLVRHTYMPGWHLPGGGVEPGETAEDAALREIAEEGGVDANERPALHGLYGSGPPTRRDHVACYIVREWSHNTRRRPAYEIAEAKFFSLEALPGETTPGTRRRLDEVFNDAERTVRW